MSTGGGACAVRMGKEEREKGELELISVGENEESYGGKKDLYEINVESGIDGREGSEHGRLGRRIKAQ